MFHYYTGIGDRETPMNILMLMLKIAIYLSRRNFILRSGAAEGADTWFEKGADFEPNFTPHKEIYLPWRNFNQRWNNTNILEKSPYIDKCKQMAKAVWNNRFNREEVDATWDDLRLTTQLLMARTTSEICGWSTNGPLSDFVICWTPDGKASGDAGQAICLAQELGINVVNLYEAQNRDMINHVMHTKMNPINIKTMNWKEVIYAGTEV